MRTGSLLLTIFIHVAWANAQTINGYGSHSIADSLKKNASKVMRYQDIQFEVEDIDHARLKVHEIVTILNEKGRSALLFLERTDKFNSLENAEINVFDSSGKNIRKYAKKDLTVLAIGEGFIDDSKTNFLEVKGSSYPLTVEYQWEIRYKGILSYPSYRFLEPEEGVESSSFTARVKKDLDLRYKEKYISLAPVVADDGKYKTYTWSVHHLAAVEEEESGGEYRDRFPSIILAPNKFRLDSYEGVMTSWEGFGNWYGTLQKGMDVLPEERKNFFRDLVRNAKDEREKIKIVYEYLQRNFRYVDIELGIGGYKPFPAAFTDKNRYGDCKALSNYMQAVLAVLGIRSHQALINAGYDEEPVDPGFPCNLFDHVILCVPERDDSIWLECTSRSNDFGHLGTFTENRNALLITENGGVLVRTPRSRARDNVFSAFTTIDLHDDGSGQTHTKVDATGEYKDDLVHAAQEKADDRKSYFVDELGFKDPDETLFPDSLSPGPYRTEIGQHIESIPYVKTSNKMFLPIRAYHLWNRKLPRAADRKQDFYFNCPFEKSDTTVYTLPEGYRPESLPEAKSSRCPLASYSTKYWYDEKKRRLYSTVRIVLTQNRVGIEDYAAVKDFFDAILADDEQKIVIRKEG